MAIIQALTKTTPQLAQLDLLIAAPLVKDSQVEFATDLTTINVMYNYPHKLVWVMAEACYYYLMTGTGGQFTDWKKMAYTASIKVWSQGQKYLEGDVVFSDGKLWSAIQDVPINTPPSSNPDYWLCIAGENVTQRYLFENNNNFIIYTEIRNPSFTAEIGSFQKQNNNYVYDTVTGHPVLLDAKECVPFVRYRNDIAPNNGIAYEVKFYTNELSVNLYSGFIIIK
jgi:hypothetical protein